MQFYHIIWPNLQSSDHPLPLYDFIQSSLKFVCAKLQLSAEDLHIKTMQKLASFLVPSACITACCLLQLLERKVQQIFFSH